MNKINRSIVKLQARDIIKNKVFTLFLIIIVVSMLTGSANMFSNLGSIKAGINYIKAQLIDNKYNNHDPYYNDDFFEHYDFFGENGFGNSSDNPIDSFNFDSGKDKSSFSSVLSNRLSSGFNTLGTAIKIVFAPLVVTLSGLFLSIVRRNKEQEFKLGEEFAGLFKNTFNETYLHKLLGVLIVYLLIGALSLLLVIPGIVFYYSSFFTTEILSDNPNLKPSEAIKLSKKMIKGNRSELFVLDLSFFWWMLHYAVTCGIAMIYVAPYYKTTRALYYENFRLRAL